MRNLPRPGWPPIALAATVACGASLPGPVYDRSEPVRPEVVGAMSLEAWELASYVVTVVGLPLAILVFLYEQRKERENEEEEVYQLLSDNYQDFLKVALSQPDLQLFSRREKPGMTAEQRERTLIVFSMLVSLFERAYLLLYDEDMAPKQSRRWQSWEDYMGEWCRRSDFRALLPQLLRGEDPQFAAYIRSLAARVDEPETENAAA